jgi:hypothetical protein
MLIDYISNLEHAEELCDEFESRVLKYFFKDGKANESTMSNYCWTGPYREFFIPTRACVQLCVMLKLEALRRYEELILEAVSSLDTPRDIQKLEDFEQELKLIKLWFGGVKEAISNFCSAFDDEEKERINEAIHNHFEGCNYSCVAMSVSAVESRLLKLMCLVSPDLEQELAKKTLGQLIVEYVKDKGKYKNVVPEKHEPLLQLCNTYRTFSVHPKKQKIKPTLASSILNLAIEFLTDQDTKPGVVKAQLIASGEDK